MSLQQYDDQLSQAINVRMEEDRKQIAGDRKKIDELEDQVAALIDHRDTLEREYQNLHPTIAIETRRANGFEARLVVLEAWAESVLVYIHCDRKQGTVASWNLTVMNTYPITNITSAVRDGE